MSCTACEIRAEGSFRSPQEDLDLEAALQDHPVLRPIAAPDEWPSHGLVELFYRCAECGQEWHYAQADFPFRGIWGEI